MKVCQEATRIIRTGSEATWRYGVEAYGLTNASLARLRSATANATASGGKQGCPVITIRAVIGPSGDPLCVATRASILWWVTIWQTEVNMRAILRKTWNLTHATIVEDDKPLWHKVVGPVGTAIANLTRIGWKCLEPDLWTDHEGARWQIAQDATKQSIAELSAALASGCTHLLNCLLYTSPSPRD